MGKPPGAPGHTVPGKDVGYMPQVSIVWVTGYSAMIVFMCMCMYVCYCTSLGESSFKN